MAKGKAKTKIPTKPTEVVEVAKQQGTAIALKWAWFALIPSFGLTLIYLNLHLIIRYLAGIKSFCRFGSEWRPPVAPNIGGETVSGALEKGEMVAVLALDLLVFALILLIIALIGIIIDCNLRELALQEGLGTLKGWIAAKFINVGIPCVEVTSQ